MRKMWRRTYFALFLIIMVATAIAKIIATAAMPYGYSTGIVALAPGEAVEL